MCKIESRDKNHGLRGYASIYDVDFKSMARAMVKATAGDLGVARFRNDHVRRVVDIAEKLAEGTKVDERKLRIACYVHDMYEYVTTQKHGELAAEFLQTFVDEYYPQETGDKTEWRKAIEAVKKHSEKYCESSNKYLDILQDADTLDKLSIEYVEGWYDNFQADSNIDVAKMVIEKVSKYNGRSANYANMEEEMLEKLVSKYGL